MSKEKQQSLINNRKKEALDINGNLIDPNKKYIGTKVKVPMLPPNHSFYRSSATIIIKGKPLATMDAKKAKFLEFLSRAPISFSNSEEE